MVGSYLHIVGWRIYTPLNSGFGMQPLSGEVRQLLSIDKPSDRGRRIVIHLSGGDYSNISQTD